MRVKSIYLQLTAFFFQSQDNQFWPVNDQSKSSILFGLLVIRRITLQYIIFTSDIWSDFLWLFNNNPCHTFTHSHTYPNDSNLIAASYVGKPVLSMILLMSMRTMPLSLRTSNSTGESKRCWWVHWHLSDCVSILLGCIKKNFLKWNTQIYTCNLWANWQLMLIKLVEKKTQIQCVYT